MFVSQVMRKTFVKLFYLANSLEMSESGTDRDTQL